MDLRKAAEELCDALQTCHICQGTVLLPDYPTHCENCTPDCDSHDEPECIPLETRVSTVRSSLKLGAPTGSAVREARKAMQCLYLEVEPSIARDIQNRVEAAFNELITANAEVRG